MPRVTATEAGLDPHFKVRVTVPGGVLHLASRTEPTVYEVHDVVQWVEADWIDDHRYGDTLGHLNWRHTTGVTWRFSE